MKQTKSKLPNDTKPAGFRDSFKYFVFPYILSRMKIQEVSCIYYLVYKWTAGETVIACYLWCVRAVSYLVMYLSEVFFVPASSVSI